MIDVLYMVISTSISGSWLYLILCNLLFNHETNLSLKKKKEIIFIFKEMYENYIHVLFFSITTIKNGGTNTRSLEKRVIPINVKLIQSREERRRAWEENGKGY